LSAKTVISGGRVTDAEAEREIRAVLDRQLAAIRAADRETLGELLADGSTHIGTDPDEWWTKEQLLVAIGDPMSVEGEQVDVEVGDVHIHVRGDVAWVESTGKFINAQGAQRLIRSTGVMVRENGQWRGAQSHASIGVPNSEIFPL